MSRRGAWRWPARALATLLAVLPAWAPALAVASEGAGGAQGGAAPGVDEPVFLGGVLEQSRILYPLRVGPWRPVAEQRYPRQEAGVSVRYADSRRGRWIDLFFYPLPARGEQALAVLASSEREGVIAAGLQAGTPLEAGPLRSLQLSGADGAAVPAWAMDVAYPGQDRASAMLLFGRQMYVVKARASAMPTERRKAAEDVDTLRQALQVFMQAIAGQVRIVSTGACWLQPEVVAAERMPAADAGGVLAIRHGPGGELQAVALRDRVLVAQARSAQAQALAGELRQALYPGCVPPEAIEPEVPADMRELRIEYRRPDADSTVFPGGPPVGRPRAPRSGMG